MAIQLSSAMSSVHHHRTASLRLLGSRSGTPWTIPMICLPVRCSRHGATRCSLEVGEKVRRKCSPFLEERKNVTNETNNNTPTYWKAIPDIWRSNAEKYGDRIALVDTYHDPPSKLTHNQVEQEILNFAEGLRQIGLLPEEKVALFADNSCRWLIADQGIMATGAINAVRGTRSSDEELFKIYTHSESIALVVDNPKFFNRLAESLIPRINVRFIVLLWGNKSSLTNNSTIKDICLYDYNEITQLGQEYRTELSDSPKKGQSQDVDTIKPDDVATLMYTSGTSGMPKGVMLTHQNLFHQVANLWEHVPCQAGDRFLSMLPSWHVYERAFEYFTLSNGIEQVYTNVNYLRDDLKRFQPHYMVSVPVVYETLYNSIQRQIAASPPTQKFLAQTLIKISLLYMEAERIFEGKALPKNSIQPAFLACVLEWFCARIVAAILLPFHFVARKRIYSKFHSSIGISKAGISGGGSLPMHVDKFFEAIGVTVQNGYGLTETSPVVAIRDPNCNVLGTIGPPLKYTEVKVVDKETGLTVPDGSKGILKFRGPQVMKGYYKNTTATEAAVDKDGWFNTGDVGWIVPKHTMGRSRKAGGMIVVVGRVKDTIVLSTGKNVDPKDLEEAALNSRLIHQIMVVGQDQRRLGAIIVPNKDEKMEMPKEKLLNLLYDEVRTWTAGCSFQIGPILIVDEPFTVDNGLLTPTMKVKRDAVTAKYQDQIANMYK
ncbi:hypothetical protein LUZ63_010014 [Rhynchospora breviuscula]|uniref:4-coumarate--CoA ligase n=1 Tax=Rhynchospora breviuscula TaxID=2022672 RepID=A0A9Q0CG54_9POAL|nr:hypothetical protein LUZ63_010014 [Rhynchospora breviuscula]